MTAIQVNSSLIAIGLTGLAIAVRLVAWPLVAVNAPAAAAVDLRRDTTLSRSARPDSLVVALVAKDPFRAARRPARVAYDPLRLGQPATPPQPKPVLAVLGIAWDKGRDATALVAGLPGADGPRPVRRGETIGGLLVKSIEADRVVITGMDTTWMLTVREPWR